MKKSLSKVLKITLKVLKITLKSITNSCHNLYKRLIIFQRSELFLHSQVKAAMHILKNGYGGLDYYQVCIQNISTKCFICILKYLHMLL